MFVLVIRLATDREVGVNVYFPKSIAPDLPGLRPTHKADAHHQAGKEGDAESRQGLFADVIHGVVLGQTDEACDVSGALL